MKILNIIDNNLIETWSFYNDSLFNLVESGIKTATCYLSSGEEFIEKFSILKSASGKQLKLETISAYELEFCEVTEQLAALEGEGDLSLSCWQAEHERFFLNELKQKGLKFNKNVKLVFEIFKVVE